jgi:hypothetical protein
MRTVLRKLGDWLWSRSLNRIPETFCYVEDLHARYRELMRRIEAIEVRDEIRRLWATLKGREALEQLVNASQDGSTGERPAVPQAVAGDLYGATGGRMASRHRSVPGLRPVRTAMRSGACCPCTA